MTRRVIGFLPGSGPKQKIFSCYLKDCKQPEHKYRMCLKHLNQLKGVTK
jgi:hypothetical protein